MRLSRLLWGVAAATIAGFIWTSVDDETTTEPKDDRRIERPLSETEGEPSRAATRAPSTPNPGGLPARDRSAGGRRSTPVASAAAQPAATAPSATAHSARPTSSDTSVARRELRVAPVSLSSETADQPPAPSGAGAPPEEKRPRSRGIGGAVLEKTGAPAAGVTVGLKARRVFNSASASSSAQTATTDGRGSFAFGDVPDGEYEIRSEKNDRYQSASTLVRAGTDSAVLVVEPISGSSVSIRGVVNSTGGGPLEGVRIEVIGQSITAATDARGAYALRILVGARIEQTTLRFRRTGYRDRRWTMADGQRSNEHEVIGNVQLEPDAAGVAVNGVVSSTNGAPVARAQVQLDSAARARSYRAVTDGAGRFTLANVEAGADYRLWARPQSGFKDGVLENVLVDAGVQLEIQVKPIGLATLRGRMVALDGAPVPGFSMFLTAASGAGPRSLTVTSDAQGRFVVADLPEGRVALQTRAAPAISVSGIEVSAANPENDVTVVVDVGAHRFEGRLLTSDGEPAAGVTVSLESSASAGGVTSRSSRQTMTDADGNFAFTQLGGGVHVVSAALAGAGSVRLEHSISAGMEPLHITLPGKRGGRQ
jgi:5-hydroxyisourate hydrolase-like protein (transthyretin family)